MPLSAAQLEAFDRDGVLVIEDACPLHLCAAAVAAVETYLGKSAGDSSGWYTDPGLRYHGLISNNAAQPLWDTRQHPGLHSIFAQLLGTERLLVSGDATNFTPPAQKGGWGSVQHIHWDMDSSRYDPACTPKLQGVLCLTDCAADQGGLVCVPGFHRVLHDWAATRPAHRNVEVPTLADVAGWQLRYVAAPAGSIVVWNSAIPHSNSRNTSPHPRIAQYITFSPASELPEGRETAGSFRPVPMPLSRTHYDVVADALGVAAGSVSDWLHCHAQSDTLLVPCHSVEVMPMQDGTTPYWLRVRLTAAGRGGVDLHSQWSSVGRDGAYHPVASQEEGGSSGSDSGDSGGGTLARARAVVAVQWPYLSRLGLSRRTIQALAAEQAGARAAALDASIGAMPTHASSGRWWQRRQPPRLSPLQLSQLRARLISRAPWRRHSSDAAARTEPTGSGDGDAGDRVWGARAVADLIGREFGAGLVDVAEARLTPLGRRLCGVEPWDQASQSPCQSAARL